ncbi:hypothetical protein E2C01_009151 [Portunus trituberculatus]|uniref:Uncharacterized protein n=1 Tax=Portunus trituberculatus TaxID=210409 RepID=A0A5B7D3W5_PORTR|nr:hypothetical protein [Portunus trituberculatus]
MPRYNTAYVNSWLTLFLCLSLGAALLVGSGRGGGRSGLRGGGGGGGSALDGYRWSMKCDFQGEVSEREMRLIKLREIRRSYKHGTLKGKRSCVPK